MLIFSITDSALPPGITLTDGSFTGNPTKGGIYSATLTGEDPGGLKGTVQITWIVGQVPVVTAAATISATGTILDGPLDTVSGYPKPEPAFQWFDGDEAIPDATSKSYDHGGADGAYWRRTTWTNGSGDPAVSTSNTITIAPAPGIEIVSLEPNPLVAGQPFTIVFNTTLAANEVTSSVALTGMGTTRTGVAPADDKVNVSISASKANWRTFSAALDVQPSAPEIFATTDNTGEIRNVTSATAPFEWTINSPARYAGTRLLTPANGASGPMRHIAPVITGGTAVGDVLTLDPGLWLTLTDSMELTWTWPDGSTGRTYTVRAEDRGTSVTVTGEGVDANGVRLMNVPGIAIPAPVATLNPGATPIGVFDGGTGAATNVVTATLNIGSADPDKTVYVWLLRPSNTTINGTVKLVVNGVDYVGSVVDAQVDTSAASLLGMDLLKFPCPAGGEATISVIRQPTTQKPRGFVYATKGLVEVGIDKTTWTMTADAEFSENIGATQAGDTIIRGLVSPQYDASGLFGSSNIITEVYDQPLSSTGPKLWFGHGIDTAGGANRNLTITPKQTGRWLHIALKMRNA